MRSSLEREEVVDAEKRDQDEDIMARQDGGEMESLQKERRICWEGVRLDFANWGRDCEVGVGVEGVGW